MMICITLHTIFNLSFPLLKDGPAYPVLKEVLEDTLKYLSLVLLCFLGS